VDKNKTKNKYSISNFTPSVKWCTALVCSGVPPVASFTFTFTLLPPKIHKKEGRGENGNSNYGKYLKENKEN
jgi:hypothetical protein